MGHSFWITEKKKTYTKKNVEPLTTIIEECLFWTVYSLKQCSCYIDAECFQMVWCGSRKNKPDKTPFTKMLILWDQLYYTACVGIGYLNLIVWTVRPNFADYWNGKMSWCSIFYLGNLTQCHPYSRRDCWNSPVMELPAPVPLIWGEKDCVLLMFSKAAFHKKHSSPERILASLFCMPFLVLSNLSQRSEDPCLNSAYAKWKLILQNHKRALFKMLVRH